MIAPGQRNLYKIMPGGAIPGFFPLDLYIFRLEIKVSDSVISLLKLVSFFFLLKLIISRLISARSPSPEVEVISQNFLWIIYQDHPKPKASSFKQSVQEPAMKTRDCYSGIQVFVWPNYMLSKR